MIDVRRMRNFYVLCCLSALAACSNGRGSLDEEQPPSGGAQQGFTVGGTITGLEGNGLVLQLNGGNDLGVANDGSFTFTTELADAAAYSVSVLTQPSGPSQTCTIGSGGGTIAGANVTNVAVTCATGTFAVGGTVSGLQGSGLQLTNAGATLDIAGNGPFQFGTLFASGATYNVQVSRNPSSPTQSCAVANNSGTVSTANVTNIAVTCMTNRFTVGGSISGLAGSRLQLRLNNQPPLDVPAGATTFTFPTLLQSGASYVVEVTRDPSDPAQDCRVAPATQTGVVLGANVTNVAVTCTTDSFRIGGSVSGLQGDGLVLRKNDGETLAIASNGSFFFERTQASGSTYEVTVQTPPTNPSQTCTIASGRGTVGSGDVRNVRVTCAVDTFAIGGTVNGLLGSGLTLLNNGGNTLNVGANGSFAFTQEVASGGTYNVAVGSQPADPTQACSVGNASGTVGASDITSVAVNCSTSDFTVGGTIDNLVGSGLELQNNGGDDLQVSSGGSFTFPTAVPSGAPYNVTVAVQPSGPAQSCTVTNPSGTVGGGPVTSVQISCVTTEFSIGGTVSGLNGSGLVLQNNGADNLSIAANGPFKFPTSLPNGAAYSVVVSTQPNSPTQACLATNSAGSVNGADVTTVEVVCVDSP